MGQFQSHEEEAGSVPDHFFSPDQFPPVVREISAYNYGFVIHDRNWRVLLCPEDVPGQVSHSSIALSWFIVPATAFLSQLDNLYISTC